MYTLYVLLSCFVEALLGMLHWEEKLPGVGDAAELIKSSIFKVTSKTKQNIRCAKLGTY